MHLLRSAIASLLLAVAAAGDVRTQALDYPNRPVRLISDSATGSFAPTGSLSRVSLTHAATLLGNGTVLVAGGDGTNAAQIYDPGTGMFRATGSMINTRGGPQATLLANGKVLFTGGIGPPYGDGVVAAESYDPASETFTPAGAAIGCHSTATRLPNGMVLLAGGGPVICSGIYSSDVGAELYDPTKGTFDFTINRASPGGKRPSNARSRSSMPFRTFETLAIV